MVKDLTQGSPYRLVLQFTASMLMSSFLIYFYNAVDSVMVGQFVTPNAIGAITVSAQVYSIPQSLVAGIVSGSAILLGKSFGAGDHKRLRRMMANLIYLSYAMSLAVILLSLLFARPLLSAIHTPEDLFEMSYSYLMVNQFGMPVFAVSWIFSGAFRAMGDSRTPFLISILSGALNVVFNYLFLAIIPCGVAGAAYGSLSASAVGGVIYLILYRKRMPLLHFGRREAYPSLSEARSLLSIGLPMGLQTTVTAVGAAILQSAINSHGSIAVTGISTGGKVLSLIWLLLQSFESALVYFCAQNSGAAKIDRIRVAVRSTFRTCLGLSGGLALLSIFFGKYIYSLFVGNDAAILAVAERYLTTQVIFFPFMTALCIWRGSVQGIGYTKIAVVCGSIELLARLVVSAFFADNLMLLFFAGPAAWAGTSIFLGLLLPNLLRRMEQKPKKE